MGISQEEKGGDASETNDPNANCRIKTKTGEQGFWKRKESFAFAFGAQKRGVRRESVSFLFFSFFFFGIARTICVFGSFLVSAFFGEDGGHGRGGRSLMWRSMLACLVFGEISSLSFVWSRYLIARLFSSLFSISWH